MTIWENTEIFSSLKLLHWLNLNCASIIGRSFTNFVFFMLIGIPRWLPLQDIVFTKDQLVLFITRWTIQALEGLWLTFNIPSYFVYLNRFLGIVWGFFSNSKVSELIHLISWNTCTNSVCTNCIFAFCCICKTSLPLCFSNFCVCVCVTSLQQT